MEYVNVETPSLCWLLTRRWEVTYVPTSLFSLQNSLLFFLSPLLPASSSLIRNYVVRRKLRLMRTARLTRRFNFPLGREDSTPSSSRENFFSRWSLEIPREGVTHWSFGLSLEISPSKIPKTEKISRMIVSLVLWRHTFTVIRATRVVEVSILLDSQIRRFYKTHTRKQEKEK